MLENLDTLRAGLPDNGLTAPTAHARLIGADQHAVFAAAAELGIVYTMDIQRYELSGALQHQDAYV